MIKRILAWFMIIGFIFLLVNLLWLKYMPEVTLGIYIVIVVVFMFSNSEKNREQRERELQKLKENKQNENK